MKTDTIEQVINHLIVLLTDFSVHNQNHTNINLLHNFKVGLSPSKN